MFDQKSGDQIWNTKKRLKKTLLKEMEHQKVPDMENVNEDMKNWCV